MVSILRDIIVSLVLIVSLLGLSFVHGPAPEEARGAAALELYYGETLTTESESTATYETHTSVTADRSGESVTKDFFVMAYITLHVDNTNATMNARLLQDTSTTLGEVNDGFVMDGSGALRMQTFQFIKEVSLDTSSHTFEIQFANDAASNNVIALSSSIIVLEKSANSEYAERTTELCTGSNTGWVDGLELAFTPSTQDEYILIWAAEGKPEDDNNSSTDGFQFINDTDTVTFADASSARTSTTENRNDNIYRTAGTVAFETVEASSHSYKIQIDGAGTSDEMCIRRAAIMAMPYDDFENVYTDSQSTKTFHTNSYSDTGVSLPTQSINAADHIVLWGYEAGNEVSGQQGNAALNVDGTQYVTGATRGRDEDGADYFLQGGYFGTTSVASTVDFTIEARSTHSNSSREWAVNNAYMVIAEIGTDVSNNAPTISSVSLNGGSNITLTENTFTHVSSTMTITDADGCSEISSVNATAYLASTTPNNGTTCTYDAQDCYTETSAPGCVATSTDTCTGGADTTVDYECGFKIWYPATPTDASGWSSSIWSISATTSDGTVNGTATNTGQTVEVNTLNAHDVTATIAYGSISPGTNTDTTNQTTTVTNTGNSALDTQLSGDHLCTDYPTCSGSVLATTSQEYALAPFDFDTAGTDITGSAVTVETVLVKPTATTSAITDLISWGIEAALGQAAGSYTGQNTFTAVAD